MSRVYETMDFLNRSFLTRDHHADFRTSETIGGWISYLAHLHRQGQYLPLPPDERFWPEATDEDVAPPTLDAGALEALRILERTVSATRAHLSPDTPGGDLARLDAARLTAQATLRREP